MLRILSFLFLFSISLTAIAQNTSSLSGKIVNAEDKAIPRTNVHLLNTNFGTATLPDGSFTITDIPYGNYRLQVSSIGYDSELSRRGESFEVQRF